MPRQWPIGAVTISLVIALGVSLAAASEPPSSTVTIRKQNQQYQLIRNGQPYFIKGIVGWSDLDLAVRCGANSIRGGGTQLDAAQKLGLTVLVNIRVAGPRRGFDYADRARVARQLDDARQTVLKYKDHPALLMWALGNELEINTTPEQRVQLWKAVNELAEMVKQVDGKHPVITVVGDKYRSILWELDKYCPSLDAVGLNSYVDMLTLPEDVAKNHFTRPYVVTEFGPRGHWQVPKTSWKMPIEDTSTEKGDFYLKAYQHAVQNQPQCLGSCAFLWTGHHQEKTHTWYNMFLPDGSPLAPVDTMTYLWTGRYPANRCPRIGPAKIRVTSDPKPDTNTPGIFPAGSRLRCTVDADDPEGNPLTIRWELRPDVADDPNIGGDAEKPTQPLEAAVVSSTDRDALIQLPAQKGKYRIFVYVYDNKGSAATANLPIVSDTPASP